MTTRPLRAAAMLVLVLALDAALLAAGVGGPRALAHHPRALALLAIWTLGGIALAAGRGARAREARHTERGPGVVALLVLIPAVTPGLSAWAERRGALVLPGGPLLHWGGVALAALGYALRIAAIRRLGARFSPLVEVQRRHALETAGVYRHVRHPGYLGAWLSNLGVVFAFGSAATLPLALLFAVALAVRVHAEERTLATEFGAAWISYRARTGAFLPRGRRGGR